MATKATYHKDTQKVLPKSWIQGHVEYNVYRRVDIQKQVAKNRATVDRKFKQHQHLFSKFT